MHALLPPSSDPGAAAPCNCPRTRLQDFRDDIADEACRAQVHRYQELAAQDIRFNPPLADACYKDRTDLCAHVPPVSAGIGGFLCGVTRVGGR